MRLTANTPQCSIGKTADNVRLSQNGRKMHSNDQVNVENVVVNDIIGAASSH